MGNFKGFTDTESFTRFPDSFLQKILPEIKDPAELKVTLYFLWLVEHMEGPFRALRQSDFELERLGLDADELASGLESAVRRGTLLKAEQAADVRYFLNSPRGRAGAEAFARGDWSGVDAPPATPRPNVFQLYEENIGPLTPMIAEALKDAEATYDPGWVSEAIALAVVNNKRSWKYAEAILKRWKEEGRAEKQDRQDSKEDRRRDVEEKIRKFVED
jgi:DnaD/phage-associated family protein